MSERERGRESEREVKVIRLFYVVIITNGQEQASHHVFDSPAPLPYTHALHANATVCEGTLVRFIGHTNMAS